MSPRYKVAYCWWPKLLAMQNKYGSSDFIGYVWRTKAFLTRNDNYGWVAFLEDQTEEKMATCPCCKRPIKDQA